ncbi:MAG: hypothetical protein V4627_09575 [Pseudomonadota bacterium]
MSSAPSSNDQPLGLTVHTLPEPLNTEVQVASRTRIGRVKMLAVLLVCASPVIASYLTYYVFRPEGRRNFGELVQPQRELPNLTARTLDGKDINLQNLKGQWLLVSVSSGACAEACARHLYLQRQLREGLGKEKERLDWVWLVNDAAPIAEALLPALKDASTLRVPPAELANWLAPQTGHTLEEHLYLVDPLGNWMMRFPANLDAQGAPKVKRDLDRLMRAAVHWDKAGR